MAKIIYNDDGSSIKKNPPMRGVPFYSDWLKILLSRGAAYEVIENDPATGLPVTKIKPLDRNQEQRAVVTDKGVGIICIGCGMPIYGEVHEGFRTTTRNAVKQSFDKIKIGGMIQVQDTEQISLKETVVKWKMQPVFKSGIGCKDCRAKYEAEVKRTNELNMHRESYARLLAQINADEAANQPENTGIENERCIHMSLIPASMCAVCRRNAGVKRPAATFKLPTPVQAFIDVFPARKRE